MIKVCVGIVVLCLLEVELRAQQMNVGVKGGLNVEELSSEVAHVSNNYHAGLFVKYDASKKTTLQLECLYSLNRTRSEGEPYLVTEFQIPLLFKYFILKPLYLQGGLQGEILTKAATIATESQVWESKGLHTEYTYLGGVGFNLPSGFDLSLRYLHPITASVFNQPSFQLSIGFDIY
ncbi:Outer membrane protein beta-barrel domain-containing protein [Reichenbachiella agariperforans]|uniref:Outer membrane protein beta-barrel domain-containing protein n=1 Tax=Reichenbachiella agariperforans TaxID=156994 RepID=A0A1M6T460_REIAG|nr:porin family protein [Reichenbachiella agariperforans]SHK51741.1 Outer membrane protein beta-barrel domain-containing protein [Reichenbachiella agariperforans]